jgi:hypothetical protein
MLSLLCVGGARTFAGSHTQVQSANPHGTVENIQGALDSPKQESILPGDVIQAPTVHTGKIF